MPDQTHLAAQQNPVGSAGEVCLTADNARPPEFMPPLETGGHRTRDEFERRYAAMPREKRAELIEGVAYMAAAVRSDRHGGPQFRLFGWLAGYEADTPGTTGGDNSSVGLDLENEPQPDGIPLIEPDRGGQAIISDDGYVERAPELVAEAAASSVSIDLHAKFRADLRNGVREYIVWRVLDRRIDWFVQRGGAFERIVADDQAGFAAGRFPGCGLTRRRWFAAIS